MQKLTKILSISHFAGRFQTKAQDLDVDDHEVKVGPRLFCVASPPHSPFLENTNS